MDIGTTVHALNPVAPKDQSKLLGQIIAVETIENDWESEGVLKRRTTRYRVMPTNTGTYFMDDENIIDWRPGDALWFDLDELRQTKRTVTVNLTNKRLLLLPSRYIVDFTCPSCGTVHIVAFAGWSAIKCSAPDCNTWCERGPYLKS